MYTLRKSLHPCRHFTVQGQPCTQVLDVILTGRGAIPNLHDLQHHTTWLHHAVVHVIPRWECENKLEQNHEQAACCNVRHHSGEVIPPEADTTPDTRLLNPPHATTKHFMCSYQWQTHFHRIIPKIGPLNNSRHHLILGSAREYLQEHARGIPAVAKWVPAFAKFAFLIWIYWIISLRINGRGSSQRVHTCCVSD